MDALTIDQFSVFAAVVEEGSFAAAARRMNRAQSAVTYAIQKLEDQSGVELFDRSAYRPVLTLAGRALLPRAQRILAELEQYRLHAKRMTMGLENDLRLMTHPYFSPALLSQALCEFNQEFPSVDLRVSPGTRQLAKRALRNHEVDVALVPGVISIGPDLEHRVCCQIEMVACAAPDHPLAKMDSAALSVALLRDHRQLAAFDSLDSEELRLVQDHGMDTVSLWRIVDFEVERELLLAGVGWAGLPLSRIEDDVAAGRLVVLQPRGWGDAEHIFRFEFAVLRAKDYPAGPACRWLFERFAKNAVV